MRSYLIWASVLLFLISIALPVVTFKDTRPQENNDETWYGWGVLLLGWLGPRVNSYAWFANVFWLVGSLLLARGGRIPLILLSVAAVLALTMFQLPGSIADWNAEGAKKQASSLHCGAYVWLASMLSQWCGAIMSK